MHCENMTDLFNVEDFAYLMTISDNSENGFLR